MKTGIETERKYIIKMPNFSDLERMESYSADEITQIYLPSENGATHRVRKRKTNNGIICTETEKIRIDKVSAIEKEGEIPLDRFCELSKNILEGTRAIKKTRYTFKYLGQVFEVDVYPEWKSTAIMEAEIPTPEHSFEIPDFITVIKEVTGMREYSNASMARSFPPECDDYL